MAAVLAACAAAQRAAGRALGEDSLWGHVLGASAVIEGVFALFALAYVVGATTTPALGWVVFLGVPVAAIVVAALRAQRKGRDSVADRRALAAARGWRYADSDPGLRRRWRGSDDVLARRALVAFGVVSGEIDGVTFTAFDSESKDDRPGRCTTWAVDLPASYPRARSWALTPEAAALVRQGWSCADAMQKATLDSALDWMAAGPGAAPRTPADLELRVEADDPGFAAALSAPAVLQATRAGRVAGWRVDGDDLLWNEVRAAPHTAAEVEAVAASLVRVARSFPADLASLWGRPTASATE
jgi:hypothetical protein